MIETLLIPNIYKSDSGVLKWIGLFGFVSFFWFTLAMRKLALLTHAVLWILWKAYYSLWRRLDCRIVNHCLQCINSIMLRPRKGIVGWYILSRSPSFRTVYFYHSHYSTKSTGFRAPYFTIVCNTPEALVSGQTNFVKWVFAELPTLGKLACLALLFFNLSHIVFCLCNILVC